MDEISSMPHSKKLPAFRKFCATSPTLAFSDIQRAFSGKLLGQALFVAYSLGCLALDYPAHLESLSDADVDELLRRLYKEGSGPSFEQHMNTRAAPAVAFQAFSWECAPAAGSQALLARWVQGAQPTIEEVRWDNWVSYRTALERGLEFDVDHAKQALHSAPSGPRVYAAALKFAFEHGKQLSWQEDLRDSLLPQHPDVYCDVMASAYKWSQGRENLLAHPPLGIIPREEHIHGLPEEHKLRLLKHMVG